MVISTDNCTYIVIMTLHFIAHMMCRRTWILIILTQTNHFMLFVIRCIDYHILFLRTGSSFTMLVALTPSQQSARPKEKLKGKFKCHFAMHFAYLFNSIYRLKQIEIHSTKKFLETSKHRTRLPNIQICAPLS